MNVPELQRPFRHQPRSVEEKQSEATYERLGEFTHMIFEIEEEFDRGDRRVRQREAGKGKINHQGTSVK